MHAAILAALGMHPDRPPLLVDLALTLYIAAAFLLLRLLSEAALLPALKAVLAACCRRRRQAGKNVPGPDEAADEPWQLSCADVFDNAYIAFMSALLLAMGVHAVVVSGNEGCVPWDTRSCLTDLPSVPQPEQRLYWLLCFHFYLNELVSTWLRVGTVLSPVMVHHHLLTLVLLAVAYKMNMLRFGTMWMALFDLSNPLLHIAKALHALDALLLTNTKWPAFAAFAAMFFVCRVLCPPLAIIKPAFNRLNLLPVPWTCFYITSMAAIYILQIHWFHKIVQMGRRGEEAKEQEQRNDKLRASGV